MQCVRSLKQVATEAELTRIPHGRKDVVQHRGRKDGRDMAEYDELERLGLDRELYRLQHAVLAHLAFGPLLGDRQCPQVTDHRANH